MEPQPDWWAGRIVEYLLTLRNEVNVAGMARFGIVTDTALGLSIPELRRIAGRVKRDHVRALELWQSDVREARLLATFTAEPKKLTLSEARIWSNDFNSWEIVDTASDLFVKARLEALIAEFAADEREFVRRAAFAMIASAAVHLKKEPDATILAFLPLIEAHAADPRNFVRKAVNWALRNIGKRNAACRGPAWQLALRLASASDKTSRWIGSDALREFRKKFGPEPISAAK